MRLLEPGCWEEDCPVTLADLTIVSLKFSLCGFAHFLLYLQGIIQNYVQDLKKNFNWT